MSADQPDNTLFVKNMVCNRCILTVESILKELAIQYQQVVIGEIHANDPVSGHQRTALQEALAKTGLQLIDDKTSSVIEKIKQLVIKKARNEVEEKEVKLKLSAYLVKHLHHEYTYLSSYFSSIEGRTIENYFIEQRVEKVKELLVYNEMTLSQIAFDMGYSSVAHLSSQFRQVTELTPSHFRKVGAEKRKLIDKL